MEATSVQLFNGEVIEQPKIGRPTKFTKDVLDKLKDAYLAHATDEQACLMAGITQQALYKYQQRNPEFVDIKRAWKSNLAFQAKRSIQKHIPRDGKLALDVIERLEKNDWSLRTELTGSDGTPIQFTFAPPTETT